MALNLVEIALALNEQAYVIERILSECNNPALPPQRSTAKAPNFRYRHVVVQYGKMHFVHLRLQLLPDPLMNGEYWVSEDHLPLGRVEIDINFEIPDQVEHTLASLERLLGDEKFSIKMVKDEPFRHWLTKKAAGLSKNIELGLLSENRVIELINHFADYESPDLAALGK